MCGKGGEVRNGQLGNEESRKIERGDLPERER